MHWLKDRHMLPAIVPNARILAYSYESRWHREAPRVRLQVCGEKLAEELHDFRGDSRSRPVVFVGHSLGGLVVLHVSKSVHETDWSLTSSARPFYTPIRKRSSSTYQLLL